jgi:hypothetical protein
MTRIPLAVTLFVLAAPALGQGTDSASPGADPMAGWKPPKVMKEQADKKEIMAFFRKMEDAGKKGDLEAAAALIDFPVLMATDDSKGEAQTGSWTKEKWTQVMAPFYKPMPEMKVTHKPTIFLITDSLASVDDVSTMTMGKKNITTRSNMLLVRVGGDWRVKSMVEGGWGDAMKAPANGEQQGTGTATDTSTK